MTENQIVELVQKLLKITNIDTTSPDTVWARIEIVKCATGLAASGNFR